MTVRFHWQKPGLRWTILRLLYVNDSACQHPKGHIHTLTWHVCVCSCPAESASYDYILTTSRSNRMSFKLSNRDTLSTIDLWEKLSYSQISISVKSIFTFVRPRLLYRTRGLLVSARAALSVSLLSNRSNPSVFSCRCLPAGVLS